MKTSTFFKVAFAALVFTACSSEDKTVTENDNSFLEKSKEGDDGGLYALEQSKRENLKQYFKFETGVRKVSFTSEGGVSMTFNTSNLKVNGEPYNGDVIVEFIEVFGLGDMVTTGMPTLGVAEGEANQESQLVPLITGGEFFVNMKTENGQDIDDGVPYKLEVPTELTGGEDTDDMISWTGEEEDDGDVVWEKDTDDNGEDRDVPVEDNRYIISMFEFGWCNIDKLEALEGYEELTGIWVDAPEEFNDTNSMVYLSYQGQMNMLTGFNDFNYSVHLFDDPYNNIPVGAQFNVIFVSSSGGQWILGVKQVTIVGNDIIVFKSPDLSVVSDPTMVAILNSLP